MSSELVDGVPTQWFPIDHGLLSWSYDPSLALGTPYTLATAGTVYVVGVKALDRIISNVVYNVTTAGATLTSGQCHVGLYQNGKLLATSADQSTAWGSTGVKTTALTLPAKPLDGLVYVAFVFNGTTGPTLSAGSTNGNVGLAAADSRYGTADTGVTTVLPTTLGTISALAKTPWVGLS